MRLGFLSIQFFGVELCILLPLSAPERVPWEEFLRPIYDLTYHISVYLHGHHGGRVWSITSSWEQLILFRSSHSSSRHLLILMQILAYSFMRPKISCWKKWTDIIDTESMVLQYLGHEHYLLSIRQSDVPQNSHGYQPLLPPSKCKASTSRHVRGQSPTQWSSTLHITPRARSFNLVIYLNGNRAVTVGARFDIHGRCFRRITSPNGSQNSY